MTRRCVLGNFVTNSRNRKMMSENTALLVIDMQKAIDHPSWGRRNNPDAEINISRLLSTWRQKGRPVIHVRHSSREEKSTYRSHQEGFEFKPEVQPQNGEILITKNINNAFIGTGLEAVLLQGGISTLVICGVTTNNSVEATARMAGDLGYQTFVVSDATASFDKIDFSGHHRTAEEVHAMSLANLQGEYATIASTEDVLA